MTLRFMLITVNYYRHFTSYIFLVQVLYNHSHVQVKLGTFQRCSTYKAVLCTQVNYIILLFAYTLKSHPLLKNNNCTKQFLCWQLGRLLWPTPSWRGVSNMVHFKYLVMVSKLPISWVLILIFKRLLFFIIQYKECIKEKILHSKASCHTQMMVLSPNEWE